MGKQVSALTDGFKSLNVHGRFAELNKNIFDKLSGKKIKPDLAGSEAAQRADAARTQAQKDELEARRSGYAQLIKTDQNGSLSRMLNPAGGARSRLIGY